MLMSKGRNVVVIDYRAAARDPMHRAYQAGYSRQ